MKTYKVLSVNTFFTEVLELMVKFNFLEEIEEANDDKPSLTQAQVETTRYMASNTTSSSWPVTLRTANPLLGEPYNITGPMPKDPYVAMAVRIKYIGNGLPIESNMEKISKEHLGLVDDKKDWGKALKQAVKDYGHDEVLTAFYEWSQSQGNTIIRKPIGNFLKNVGSHIGVVNKPVVSSPVLGRVEARVAFVSDNLIFFTGDYRFRLSALIREYGEELVIEAFEQFFQTVDDKEIKWASRNFIERAPVMIQTIVAKKEQERVAKEMLNLSYKQAQEGVLPELEDEEEEL